MTDDIVSRARGALPGLGNESGLYELERYRKWLGDCGPRDLLAEVERLRATVERVRRLVTDGQTVGWVDPPAMIAVDAVLAALDDQEKS